MRCTFPLEFRTNTIEEENNFSRYDFPSVRNKELKYYNFIIETLMVYRLFKRDFPRI